MARVTLDRLDQKLDDVIDRLKEATRIMADHIQEDRQVYVQVDRLTQGEQRRQWHFRTIWVAIIGTASSLGLMYFK